MHPTKRRRVWGISMEDFGVLWVWGFRGDSHRFFCGYGMGTGIEIQSPRQPWVLLTLLVCTRVSECLCVCLSDRCVACSGADSGRQEHDDES